MPKTEITPASKSEQLCEWVGIAVVLGSAYLWVSLLTHDPADWGGMAWPPNLEIANSGSRFGAALSWFLFLHFGLGAYAIAASASAWGGALFLRRKTSDPLLQVLRRRRRRHVPLHTRFYRRPRRRRRQPVA